MNKESNKLFKSRKEKKRGPYLIAEIGVNHEGSLSKAFELIELAKNGGADAVKFQSYKAETLTVKEAKSYWDLNSEPVKSQYELFKKYDSFNENEYEKLFQHCKRNRIDFMSTPFDIISVDYLDKYVSIFKIASADITNIPLLRRIGSKKKPVVISTGASEVWEIDLAIKELEKSGSESIALLHCVLNYPTSVENANLDMIPLLGAMYPKHVIGYSDHTLPDECMTTLVTAEILGAKIIEKHFTDNKNLKGNDHYHSMDIHDLKRYIAQSEKIALLRGKQVVKQTFKSEVVSRQNARRSIVASRDLKKGEVLTEACLTTKRPGTGISPTDWDEVIGKKIKDDIPSDTIIKWSDIK
jgi:N-acetylneuraminate synthase